MYGDNQTQAMLAGRHPAYGAVPGHRGHHGGIEPSITDYSSDPRNKSFNFSKPGADSML